MSSMLMSSHRSLVHKECEPSFSIIDWNLPSSLKWMEQNWHYTVYVSIAYMVVIYSIQQFMRTREPFKLRKSLTLWNTILTIFSTLGSYYMLPEMYDSFYLKGINNSVCIASTNSTAQYWMWLFAISKIFELGDTIFIVLRKQKLILLHWFHHILSLIYTWYSYGQNISLGRWFVTMNLVVHSFMYAYYAFRSMQIRIPRQIAMAVTTMQIVQMIFGFYVSAYAFYAKLSGQFCEIPLKTATFGFFVYTIFFFMFAKLFVNNYLCKLKINDCAKHEGSRNGTEKWIEDYSARKKEM
ncbi:hypothetical protein NH340_JMT01825 [Sarcoptes scabiei]|nr:hypothetical protein NH340_JMT01825 [Sarcoptes scabiei]